MAGIMKVEITNPEDVPDDLPPGRYDTRIVKAELRDGEFYVDVEFIGTPYAPVSSLIQVVKQ